ncbi:ABC transporter substrate-binding protein [Paenibacillus albicereus]|uniref:ABC transporter substrate-binding protein n=1 Tax=Paenibacillus albicereus TaxID=2726185 RepID=A0A6H2GX30_9BACL|nr:ABC transporter substrate-binding protein [Paenibacillus albicereus]QJC51984.1 ABC transporter substrate-binding protein [Paenibacillus albicereus]
MKRKAIGGLLLAAALAMALPGCGAGKDEAVQVRIGEVTRSVFYAPQYVALSEGFFKQEGLDVELQTTAGGDKTMTALLSGGVDVALVGPETSIYVYQQGAEDPVLSFAQVTQTDGTFLVSRSGKELDWNDLMGAKFLGQRKGGMPQMAGEFALKKHGIDPHADLDLIQNIDFANITAAYASGTGDYVQLFEPQASMIEQEGKGKVVASFGVESGHLPYTAFMSKQSYIEKNADTVQKFTDALQKAQAWVQEHSAEDIADAVGSFFPNTDKAILVSSIDRYKQQGSYAENPIIDEQEWNNLLDVMASAGELKERAEHGKLVDNSFAEKAGR